MPDKDYYMTPHWRKIRLERLEIDGYQCRVCGSGQRLEVHHIRYDDYNEDVWMDLTTLCTYHHEMYTNDKRGRIYAKVKIEPVKIESNKEYVSDGVARNKIQIDRESTLTNAQWFDGRPAR